jgi:DNA-binding LytR/AlgR family response regulator
MKIRALIVDDEPLAREGVALALAAERDVEVVGACEDGPSAVAAIRELAPDLVFLDVKMPGLDGFAVIGAIGADRMPPVIFLTAYEEHALRAFRVNAVDYLLKPIDAEELRKSVERARRRLAQNEAGAWRGELRALVAALAPERTTAVDARDRLGGGRRRLRNDPYGRPGTSRARLAAQHRGPTGGARFSPHPPLDAREARLHPRAGGQGQRRP